MSAIAEPTKIPLLDTRPEIDSIWDELQAAIESVVKGGQFIMGPNVKAFEQEVADYFGVKHAIGLNSGTDALILGVHALGIQPGDEIITTPFTFFATTEAISHFHATPVLVDIDPKSYNFDIRQLESNVTSKTKAIIPVHIYGHAVDMDPVMELAARHGLAVLEDVAQAFGAKYRGKKVGTIGNAGAFSFFPSKNLGGFGDGGMLITDEDAIAESVRMMRVHGAKKKYYNEAVGVNSRLDEMQAAILRIKLRHIDTWNAKRREVAARYTALLNGVEGVSTPNIADYTEHVFHQYTIRILNGKRDQVQQALSAANIGTFVYYPVPIHRLPVYAGHDFGPLPVADQLSGEVLSLPIWPLMESQTQERVVNAIRQALAS
ncbi:MAG: dTDP-3-amino-3,4,6-trideoxy-alpha-D-glucose transaminase [Fimbriimonadaceae bacterium]|nr:dTDP-3-amino-3,4,6-trideoxy-alpha-D-glucose transaminase [Fimbriimonadaceae bacterium]